MRLLITSLLLHLTFIANAQWPLYVKQQARDSILTCLANAPEDTVKVNLYLSLFYNYVASKRERHRYAANIISLSRKLNYTRGIAEGYICSGQNGNFLHRDEALADFGMAKYLFETLGDQRGLGHALLCISVVYNNYLYEYDKSLDVLLQSKKIFEAINDSDYLSIALYDIGACYNGKKDYSKAIEYYKAANVIFKALDKKIDTKRGQALAYWAMGHCYKRQGKYNEAEASAKMSLDLARSADCNKCVRFAEKLLKLIPASGK